MEELIEEEKIEIVQKLIEYGHCSQEKIAQTTDIPLEKVKELAIKIQLHPV
ncbi:MAG: hypothetical protein MJ196_07500 [Treponemataceae bacterium]|nr:hypothetical protein [Treponemataceae bacterium]